jgi:hypothetical protein
LLNLCYTSLSDSHLDFEGGWSSHGNEESSGEEACEEKGREEEEVRAT